MQTINHFALWTIGLKKATTQTSDAERNCLARHANGKRRLAEVGVWHGVTTKRLRGAMDSAGVLFAIDPYYRGRLGLSFQKIIAHREVGRLDNGKIEWLRMTGAEAAQHLRGREPLDFVFIDGDHKYEGLRADYEGFLPLVAPGGILALHDSEPCATCPADAGSVRYTREVILKDPTVERVDVVDSLTILRKKVLATA
jgi:predicted O-methyltransferase YrrM